MSPQGIIETMLGHHLESARFDRLVGQGSINDRKVEIALL